MNKFICILLVVAVVSAEELQGVRRTKIRRRRQAGGGCVYNGQTYQQGQKWEVPCKFDCYCQDSTTGTYRCTEKCPHYDNLPQGCYMVKQPNSCCSTPQCDFSQSGSGSAGSGQVITGTGSGTGMVSGGGTAPCQDTIPNCKDYGDSVCTQSSYRAWVQEHCAAFCGMCGGSMTGGTMTGSGGTMTGTGGTMTGTGGTMTGTGGTGTGGTMTGTGGTMTGTGGTMTGTGGTMTGACVDAIPTCSNYGSAVCTNQMYAAWVKQNCAKYCNKCGENGYIGGTSGQSSGSGTVVIPGYQGQYVGSGQGSLTLTGGSVVSGTSGGSSPSGGSGTSGGSSPSGGSGGDGDGGFSLHIVPGTSGSGSAGSGSSACMGDKIPNCSSYDRSVCTDASYRQWATANCCMFCSTQGTGGTSGGGTGMTGGGTGMTGGGTGMTGGGTGMTGTGTSGACYGDKLVNCNSYGSNVCTDPKYTAWVAANCCMYCRQGGGMTGGSHGGTGGGSVQINNGQGGHSGHSTGCVYKGKIYQQGQTWKDGCQFSCTCTDGASGRYTCKQLCVQWNLPSSCSLTGPAPGMCCKTPSCPSNVQVNYPPGYIAQ